MNEILQFLSGLFDISRSLFNFFMGNWLTSLFFFGMIIMFILDLVISSSSDDE